MRPVRYRAEWIIPATSPPLRDGALLVDADGRIAAIGPAASVDAPEAAESIDLGEAAIVPGLVNAHAHPDLSCLRGALEDLEFVDWMYSLPRIRRQAGLTDADHIAAARWSCLEMLAAGITAVGATEDSAGAFTALRESGQRGLVFREAFGPDPAMAGSSVDGLRGRIDAMRRQETDLVRAGVSPHSPVSVSDELFRAVAAFAAAERLPVAVHAAESAAERDLVTRGGGGFASRLAGRGIPVAVRGRSTIALLDRTGILDLAPLLVHCVDIDERDMALIAASGASVVHCPVANARLGHGIAPVAAMREAGITVALGSDSVASNNRVDLLEEARAAQLFQRATTGSTSVLAAPDVLRMATIDGARALGLDSVAGQLRAGLDADLCIIRLDRPHLQPVHDPVATVIHSARASDVVLTAVRGRVLYRGGEFPTVDVDTARLAIDGIARRIRSVLASLQPGPQPV